MIQTKPIDIDALRAGRELDRAVAVEVMEWELLPPNNEFDGDIYFRLPDFSGVNGGGVMGIEDIPRYSTFHPYTVVVEEYIERRGLADAYITRLVREVYPGYPSGFIKEVPHHFDVFKIITATPEQRCRAALKAARNDFGAVALRETIIDAS